MQSSSTEKPIINACCRGTGASQGKFTSFTCATAFGPPGRMTIGFPLAPAGATGEMLSWLPGRLVTHTACVVRDGGFCAEIGPIRMRFKMSAFLSLPSLDSTLTANSGN